MLDHHRGDFIGKIAARKRVGQLIGELGGLALGGHAHRLDGGGDLGVDAGFLILCYAITP